MTFTDLSSTWRFYWSVSFCRPRVRLRLRAPVVRIQLGTEQKECRVGGGGGGGGGGLVARPGPAEDRRLALQHPLLETLIPAEGVFPPPPRNVPPVDRIVE